MKPVIKPPISVIHTKERIPYIIIPNKPVIIKIPNMNEATIKTITENNKPTAIANGLILELISEIKFFISL